MKRQNLNNKQSGFENDYSSNMSKKVGKDKSSKRRLSIYDDYEEDDDEFAIREKFNKKHK